MQTAYEPTTAYSIYEGSPRTAPTQDVIDRYVKNGRYNMMQSERIREERAVEVYTISRKKRERYETVVRATAKLVLVGAALHNQAFLNPILPALRLCQQIAH